MMRNRHSTLQHSMQHMLKERRRDVPLQMEGALYVRANPYTCESVKHSRLPYAPCATLEVTECASILHCAPVPVTLTIREGVPPPSDTVAP